MKKVLRVLKLRGVSISDQLRWEEILLRRSKDNWYIFNTNAPSVAIVLGFSAKVPELVNLEAAVRDKVQLIRRYTGGGTVVIDSSTVFSTFIMNDADVPSKPYPRDIMNWSDTDVYGPVFQTTQTDKSESNEFSLRENDYVLGPLKIGGNAQSIIKNRWVHHTSFLWDFDPKNMLYLKMPKKRPEYRVDRDHDQFLSRLKNHLPSFNYFEERIVEQLETRFDVVTTSSAELARTLAELATHDELDELIRTKIESADEHFEMSMMAPSLVRTGPSCTNI